MDDLVTQVGVGGVLALLIVREVLNFIKNNKHRHCEQVSVERREFDEHKKSVRYVDTCDEIHKGIQRQFGDVKEALKRIENLIRKG